MTYKQLLEQLSHLAPERLDDTVTVLDPDRDEMIAVSYSGIAEEDDCDIIDPGHLYLVLNSDHDIHPD